jgi:type II secretory pathway pseudopilin PulG
MKKFLKDKNGYTLVELLAVMVVLVAIGTIVSAIITSVLRGSNKANNIEQVRKNGGDALLQIVKSIKFAQSFNGVSTDGVTYTTNCVTSSPPPSSPPQYPYLKITSFDGGKTTISCTSSTPQTIASNSASLIDTQNVAVTSCYFTCSASDITQPPTIGVNFTLSQKNLGSFGEDKASIPFQTSVTFRNLNK